VGRIFEKKFPCRMTWHGVEAESTTFSFRRIICTAPLVTLDR
jgi:hypothetical protein